MGRAARITAVRAQGRSHFSSLSAVPITPGVAAPRCPPPPQAPLSVIFPGKLLLSALRRTLTEHGISLPPRKQGARGCLLLLSLGKGDREPSLTAFAWMLSPRMASEATARAAVPALPFPAEVAAMAPAQAPVKWPQAMIAGTRGTGTDLSPEGARLPPLHLPDTPELGPAPSRLSAGRLCAAGVFPWAQHLFSETLLRFPSPPPCPGHGSGFKDDGKGRHGHRICEDRPGLL